MRDTGWRQLDLLKGPRQRGTRAPAASEFATHCAIADTLRVSLSPRWTWLHPPNGEERPAFINKRGKRVSPAGERLKRMGARSGASDFLLAGPPHATLHALELKARGETPSLAEEQFLQEVIAAGGKAAWVDNYNDAIAQFKAWGAVKTSLKVQL